MTVPRPDPWDELRAFSVDAAGVDTRVLAMGDQGPPVVFLHGLTGHAELWLSTFEHLGSSHRLYAPDLVGRGFTPLPPGLTPATAYDVMIRQVVDVLERLEVTSATLVGSSLGAFVATHVALDRPDLVGRLVVVGSGTVVNTPDQLRRSSARSLHNLRQLEAPITRKQLLLHLGDLVNDHTKLLPEYLHARLVIFGNPATRANMVLLSRCLNENPPVGRHVVRERIGELTRPTLWIWGSDDRRGDLDSARLVAARAPGASFEVLEGCGHLPFLEQPARFSDIIGSFALDGVTPAERP